jgi:hypothetical protein
MQNNNQKNALLVQQLNIAQIKRLTDSLQTKNHMIWPPLGHAKSL